MLHARTGINGPSWLYFGDTEKQRQVEVGWLQRRWIDDIKKEVDRSWFRIAQDLQKWKRHGEAYVKKRMENCFRNIRL